MENNESGTPDQVHGRLLEGVHLAGYTFERACANLEWLLDEDRWRRVGNGYDSVNNFLAAIRLDDFRVVAEQRKRIAQRIKALQPEAENTKIAKMLGVDETTIRRDTSANAEPASNKAKGTKGRGGPTSANAEPTPAISGARAAKLVLRRDETEARRAAVAARVAAAGVTAAPTGKYRIIYADPPWSYGNTQPDYQTEQRDHYPVMTIEAICDLPVKEWAEENAVLFLWVTSPMVIEASAVITSWGFEYKALFVWDKIKHNMGHYNSVRHELLYICTRGSCQPDKQQLFDSVQSIERGKHSAKPAEFYDIIETIYTHGRKLEIFARTAREGWDVYGHISALEAAEPNNPPTAPEAGDPGDIPHFLRRTAT